MRVDDAHARAGARERAFHPASPPHGSGRKTKTRRGRASGRGRRTDLRPMATAITRRVAMPMRRHAHEGNHSNAVTVYITDCACNKASGRG